MNIWNPEYANWVGEWNDYSLPAFSYYDWVSYASYTPGNGNTGTDNNFTLKWHDDLNFFDATRWGKATHTWSGNMSDFIPENVVFKDGKLILCLTDATNLGYQDVAKPVLVWAKAFSNGNVELKFSEELDKTTAESVSNYTLPGATIKSANLSNDLTTVTLETESYDPTVAANIIVLNVTDIWGNTIAAAAKTIIAATYPEFRSHPAVARYPSHCSWYRLYPQEASILLYSCSGGGTAHHRNRQVIVVSVKILKKSKS